MRTVLFAAALSLIAAQPALADASRNHAYRAAQTEARASASASVVLALVSAALPRASVGAHTRSGPQRTVALDGVVTELGEDFLRAQIAAGAIAVVYPGTERRWTPYDGHGASYPPAWF